MDGSIACNGLQLTEGGEAFRQLENDINVTKFIRIASRVNVE